MGPVWRPQASPPCLLLRELVPSYSYNYGYSYPYYSYRSYPTTTGKLLSVWRRLHYCDD